VGRGNQSEPRVGVASGSEGMVERLDFWNAVAGYAVIRRFTDSLTRLFNKFAVLSLLRSITLSILDSRGNPFSGQFGLSFHRNEDLARKYAELRAQKLRRGKKVSGAIRRHFFGSAIFII
jgi:hypothetical protein